MLVNRAHDQRRPVPARQRAHALEFLFAVFQVDRVDDALALAISQRQFQRARIGGVDHHRRLDLSNQLLVERRRIAQFVALGALEAHIHNLRAVAHLAPRNLAGLFPLFFRDKILEQARADYVGALADDQRPVTLLGLDHPGDGRDMLVRGSAAAARQIQPPVGDEAAELGGDAIRGFAVPAFRVRHARVRIAGDARGSHGADSAEVIGHELRTGAAIQADA